MQPVKLFGLLLMISVGCSAPNEGGADDQEVALSSTIVTETHVFEELADESISLLVLELSILQVML